MALFRTSIRRYLTATVLAVCAPTAVVSAWLAANAALEYLDAVRIERSVAADRALLELAADVDGQRIAVGAAIAQDDKPAPRIEVWKSRVEASVARAAAAIAATDVATAGDTAKALR